MSLKKFANIFNLEIGKGLFPYELFRSIDELEERTIWPNYSDFRSSLPSKKLNFLNEIDEILNLSVIYGFESFGSLLDFLQISLNLTSQQYISELMPDLSELQKDTLEQALFLSPKVYFAEKFVYDRKIQTGEFKNFLDHLRFYNGKDSDLHFS